MSAVWVKCPYCGGCGRRRVTGVYLDTLRILRKRTKRGLITVAGRHAEQCFKCKPTALNQRLRKLAEYGLARFDEYGKEKRFWSVEA